MPGSNDTTRRAWLLLFAVVLAGVCVAAGVCLAVGNRTGGIESASAQTATRPNILFVMTDDMPKRLWSMPTLREQVAANGVRFTNAYLTQSLCCPSRATILTGKYPHNHGITGNSPPNGGEVKFRRSGQDRDTVATRLRSAGYRTALVGKYMNAYPADGYRPPGWSYWYAKAGQSSDNKVNENGTITSYTGSFPIAIADKAMRFLDRSTDQASDPPFMLFYWTSQPHLPASVPSGYHTRFQDARLPRPPSFNEADVSDKPAYIRNLPLLTRTQIDQLEADHKTQLRNMAHIDDTLARMLNLLRDRGKLSRTYVVFATDNGTHMGEHRYNMPRGSKSTPYEEAASTPLIIRGPGVQSGVVRDQLVANNDLAPTFARWGQTSAPAGFDGRSITPLLSASPPSTWRTALLNERHLLEPDDSPSPNYQAIFTAVGYRYVEYETDERELYDLRTDPYELNSKRRAGNEELYDQLSARLAQLRSCAGATCRSAEGP
jgi:N-acetylglucosamine-6-sulfatase